MNSVLPLVINSFRYILQSSTATRPRAAAPLPFRFVLVLVSLSLFWALPLQAANSGNGKNSRVIGLSGNLAFGNVAVGSSAQSTLTIANNGTSTLTVSSVSYPNGFSGNWSGTILAGGSQPVTVTFAPTSATGYSGTVTVSANQTSGGNTIPASGTGTMVVGTRVIGLSGNLAFGNVAVGSSAQSTLTIANNGTSTLTVSSVSYPSGFSGNWSGTILAGGSQPVTVTFAPTSATGYSGTVTVNANQTSGGNTIPASGTGTMVVGTRVIGLSGNLAFGNVAVGSSAQSTLTIANNGTSTLTVSSVSYPSGFSGNWSGTILAGGSQPVTVTFAPTSATGYGGTVTVNANQTSGGNTSPASGTGTTTATGTAYVTGVVPGTLRNDYSGWVGMQIVVGANPLTVTQLGRMMVSGNSGTHTVKLVNAIDGTDVSGGSVSVAMSGGTAGQFQYGSLSSAVTLAAGTAYLVLSQETAGGDSWYNWDTKLTTTGVAADNAVAYGTGPGAWNTYAVANQAHVPVDFKYGSVAGQPPVAPSNLSATAVSSSQINLAWTDNSSNESGFIIQRASSSAGPWTQIATVGAGVTSYADTGLSASTTYYYQVYASNSYGNSSYTSASATTLAPPGQPPAAPSNLSATTASSSQINLAWTDNSSNESGFIIQRAPTSSGPWTPINVGAGVTSYTDTGLSASTTYYYQVCAYNSYGNSGYTSASATTLAPPGQPPAAPSNLSATTASSSQINLAWTDNSSNESGFIIQRAPTSSGPWTPINVGAGVTSYTDTGLGASTTYYYQVCAYNSYGYSGYTSIASATTSPVTGGTPGQLQWLQTSSQPYMAQVNGVATDHAGNVIAVGWFYNSVDFGSGLMTSAGGYDAFVVKYSPQGALLWVKRLGGAAYDSAAGVAIDSQNNIIIVGSFTGSVDFGGGARTPVGGSTDMDAFVAKYSPSGAYIWATTFGCASNDQGTSVAVDGSDNVLVTSESASTVYFGNGITKTSNGGYDVTVAKFSGATGTCLWGQMYGGPYNDFPYGVASDLNGDVLVVGKFLGGGGNLGGSPLAGSQSSGSFVAKYSGLDGSYKWSWILPGNTWAVTADPATANVFITGAGASGFFVNAYNSLGSPLWARAWGNAGDTGWSIAADGNGNLALTGSCGSVDWFGNYIYSNGAGYFVAGLTTTGAVRWDVQGNDDAACGYGVSFDTLGHIFTGGNFKGTADFGGISATAGSGVNNAFVAQYSK